MTNPNPTIKTHEASKPAPSIFNEQGAVADLVNVKTSAEKKRADFQPCINFVRQAREKNMSWADIAEKVHQHGGPKLTGSEVSMLFQENGRIDPSPRAARKAEKSQQTGQQDEQSDAANKEPS